MSPRKPPTGLPPFAINLRQLREHLGLSQQAFAESLAVTQQTLSYWEKGLRQPSRRTWIVLTQRLGYSRVELEGPGLLILPPLQVAESWVIGHEVALPPIRKGIAAVQMELEGLHSEPLDMPKAQRVLREALRANRPVWIILGRRP